MTGKIHMTFTQDQNQSQFAAGFRQVLLLKRNYFYFFIFTIYDQEAYMGARENVIGTFIHERKIIDI